MDTQEKNKKTLIMAATIAGIILVCCAGILLILYLFKPFSQSQTPIESPIFNKDIKPSYYGVFIKENDELIELQEQDIFNIPTEGEIDNVQIVSNSQPIIVVWLSDINLNHLELYKLNQYLGQPANKITYNTIPKDDGVIEIMPKTDLDTGIYCLIQGDPLAAILSGWCFRMGSSTQIQLTTPESSIQQSPINPSDFKVALITDLGGINDNSFNSLAYTGIELAAAELGVKGKYLESRQQSDYGANIQQLLIEDTNLIITVGFLLGVDTAIAAKANPSTKFAIVDYSYPDCFSNDQEGKTCGSSTELPNVLGLTFPTDQAAFLAGYVAAATTRTGKVAIFGGINIPPVTIYMKGFEAGVAYYNAQKGKDIEVLGWNTAVNDGSFTGNFDSLDDGRSFAESFVREGADIIMPVAGPVGLGSAAYCKETGSCKIIGVDVDWTIMASKYEYTDAVLTSVLKNINVAVHDAIKAAVDGTFKGGVYVSTLANGGVSLAPVSGASAELKADLEKLQADIISGAVSVSQ